MNLGKGHTDTQTVFFTICHRGFGGDLHAMWKDCDSHHMYGT